MFAVVCDLVFNCLRKNHPRNICTFVILRLWHANTLIFTHKLFHYFNILDSRRFSDVLLNELIERTHRTQWKYALFRRSVFYYYKAELERRSSVGLNHLLPSNNRPKNQWVHKSTWKTEIRAQTAVHFISGVLQSEKAADTHRHPRV